MNDNINASDVECLIMWPNGTKGYKREQDVLNTLLKLCRENGFGRIPQLANQILELWNYPERKPNFVKRREEHFAMMRDDWEVAFPGEKCPY